MEKRYRLVELKNSELLVGLSALVQRSNAITAEELAHLAELEDRMLHLELGFPSLFGYCVEALGMSEGAAGRRVAAARVCRRFPQAFGHVARGDLHLSALCALSSHLDSANASELFETCRRKTRRQIEELLAARFPRPDVREQIRRLPVRSNELAGAALEAPRHREIEALSAERFGVHFSALPTGAQSTPPGGASALLAAPRRKVMLPARFRRARKGNRYLSAPARRSVYLRDQGQCSFVSADGRRCGARAFLQLDHIEPWAALGASVTENIRILCRGHNQLHARHCFGARHVAAKIAARHADANDERTEI